MHLCFQENKICCKGPLSIDSLLLWLHFSAQHETDTEIQTHSCLQELYSDNTVRAFFKLLSSVNLVF